MVGVGEGLSCCQGGAGGLGQGRGAWEKHQPGCLPCLAAWLRGYHSLLSRVGSREQAPPPSSGTSSLGARQRCLSSLRLLLLLLVLWGTGAGAKHLVNHLANHLPPPATLPAAAAAAAAGGCVGAVWWCCLAHLDLRPYLACTCQALELVQGCRAAAVGEH